MTQAILGQRLDRWILKKGFSTAKPLLALRLIEARRALIQVRSTKHVPVSSKWVDFVPKHLAYRTFVPDTFPEIPGILAACQSIYEAHVEETRRTDDFNKQYFFNIATIDDLISRPELMAFALSPTMSDIVFGYMPNPRLNSIGLFYSAVNDSIAGSQLFHVDGDCLKQMKCFVNIWDVDDGAGPLTFIPASLTNPMLRNRGLIKDISDAEVDKEIGAAPYIRANGPAGSGVFCDTSRCLHQGSRALKKPRLVLVVQFVSRPDALLERKTKNGKRGGHIMITKDLLKTLGVRDERSLSLVD